MKNLKIIIASDSFKGSATSKEVANYIEKGIKKFYKKELEIIKIPIADGGDGTVEAIIEGTDGEYKYLEVFDPLRKTIQAKFGIFKNTAILEMAEAAGINLLKKEELNPYITSTFGVGQMLKKILDLGIKNIYIGLGGSATNDGGAGMLSALGAKFYDINKNEIGYTPIELEKLDRIDLKNLDKRLLETKITILSDVNNPLYGKNGASYIYGPQKGATPEMIEKLDNILKNYAEKINTNIGKDYSNEKGSGAAGGLGFALRSICNAEFKQGIMEIIKILNFENRIKNSDLIITGEGRIDNQSVNGKTPIGIAKLAKKYNIPVIAVVGSSDINLDEIYKNGIDLVIDVINEPISLEEAMTNTEKLIEFAGEKAIRAFCLKK